jgi:hypothetical protein
MEERGRLAGEGAHGCDRDHRLLLHQPIPEAGMTFSSTSVAAARITTAMVGPNDFSRPVARGEL